MKKVTTTKHFLLTVLVLTLLFGGKTVGEASTGLNMEPEEVSRSTATNYGYTVETALDAEGNQYVFSSSTLFKKELGRWSSHAVSPEGLYVYSVVPDQAGIVHLLYAAESSFYHAECPSDLADGVACPAGEIIGPGTRAASMVVDVDGTLHVVYGSSQIYYRQRVQGGAWTEPVAIYAPSSGLRYALPMKLDPDGRTLHLAGGNYYSPYKVYYGKRTPDGTWTFETVVAEGPVWGRLGLALDSSNHPHICYGNGPSYGPLKLASRDAAGVWTTEVLAQPADLGWDKRGYAADCDIFDDTLYVIATIGKPSGSSTGDEFDPHIITKALPDGAPVYHGTIGDTGYYVYKGDVAMAVGETVSVAWTLTPIAECYTGYVFSVYDLSNVVPGNNVAVDDGYSIDEDQTLTVAAPGVLTNDTDAEGDPLTAVLFSDVSHGMLTLNANGSFTYTPEWNFNGTDSFTYKTNDGNFDSNLATVTITVNPVYDPPADSNIPEPEEVSRSTATNYGYTVETALDADGNQYVFSSSTLFKKEPGGWSSHAVSPEGYYVYSVVPDDTGIVHLLYAAESSFYHAECPSDLADGVACPAGEIIGPWSPYTQRAASMVVDADGTLHVVYGSSQIYYRQRVQGGDWTEPVAIYPPCGRLSPYAFPMKLDPDGRTLHLAGGNYYSPHKVYYGKRTPDGTWTFETVVTEGPVWGRLGLALDGSNPHICYGNGPSYGPLKLASRDSAGVWTTEVLAQSTDLSGRGLAADCDILGDTLYVITTIGKPSGAGSGDDFNPHLITKALPDGDPVYHGRIGNIYNVFRGDIAMDVGETVPVAWTLSPLATGYNGYVFAIHDLSTVISGNNAPMSEAGGPYTVAEGGSTPLDGSGSTDNEQDPATLTYEWDLDGDGEYNDATGINPIFSAAALDGPASVTVGLKVTDDQGASDSDTATVDVTNVAPTANPDMASVAEDGPAVTVAVLTNDSEPAGAADPLTITGVDTTGTTGGVSFTASDVTYDPNGQFESLAVGETAADSFDYTIDDGDGGTASATVNVTVNGQNDTPTVAADNAAVTVDEGQTAANSGTFADVDGSDKVTISASVSTITQDSGNSGTWSWSFDATDGPAESQTVTITADDGNGGVATTTFALTVNNVAPTIETVSVPPEPVNINDQSSFSVDVTFSDPAGVHDELYACAFDLDNDGNDDTTDPEVTGTSCSAVLNYAGPGVYTVKVTVTDKDGGQDSDTATEFIVIYDPEGGFVTGGGWIWSEAGFCKLTTECEGAEGKANFGFVSKYKKGADTPTGETEFQFKAGNLNFHSDSYEWLVVANHKAMYKGVGTINGVGNYGFMLSAIDEKLTPSTDVDLFRIKIWDKDDDDTIVYDNQMGVEDDADPTTAIGGGNIVIHK